MFNFESQYERLENKTSITEYRNAVMLGATLEVSQFEMIGKSSEEYKAFVANVVSRSFADEIRKEVERTLYGQGKCIEVKESTSPITGGREYYFKLGLCAPNYSEVIRYVDSPRPLLPIKERTLLQKLVIKLFKLV